MCVRVFVCVNAYQCNYICVLKWNNRLRGIIVFTHTSLSDCLVLFSRLPICYLHQIFLFPFSIISDLSCCWKHRGADVDYVTDAVFPPFFFLSSCFIIGADVHAKTIVYWSHGDIHICDVEKRAFFRTDSEMISYKRTLDFLNMAYSQN